MPLAKNFAYKRPLTAAFVKAFLPPGKYYDGLRSNGLLLNVSATGRKYWEARVRVGGVRRTFGLGRYPDLSLLAARHKAKKLALDACAGRVPVRRRRPPTAAAPTFRDAARQAIELRSLHWTRRDVIVLDWINLFERYVHPTIGSIAVSDLTPQDILDVLTPLRELAPTRVPATRQRIGAVLKWAIAKGYRRDNPAAAELLSGVLGPLKRAEHHRALPHADVPAALDKVRRSDVWIGARLAFEFLVLTAVRGAEALGARWEEFDFEAAMWRVPAARMKMGVAHRVPLSARALSVVVEARESADLCAVRQRYGVPDRLFVGSRGRSVRRATLSKMLKDLSIGAVAHGFRSSFRDWCGETRVAFEVAEACLAHTVGNQVTAAYARSDLYNRRIEVMENWSQYLTAGVDGPSDGSPDLTSGPCA